MSAPALTLDRARAGGALATRERLGAALGWWRADPAAQNEWLVVPRLQLAFAAGRNQSPDAIAREFGKALARERIRARVDPPPGEAASGPLHFTSASRWYAWLAGQIAEGQSRLPAQQRSEGARQLRTAVLGEPLLLIAVARRLNGANLMERWCAQLSDDDAVLVRHSCAQAFGQAPQTAPPKQRGTGAWRTSGDNPRAATPELSLAKSARALLAVIAALPNMPPRSTAQGIAARALLAAVAHPGLAASCLAILLEQPCDDPVEPAALPRPTIQPDRQREARTGANHRPRSGTAAPRPYILPAACEPRLPRMAASSPAEPTPLELPTRPAQPLHLLPNPNPPALPEPELRAEPDQHFGTAFAGVLFLLNCFTALELYPDFTRPLGNRLAPSPSWLLERVALQLFGRSFAADPLRRWLAHTALPGALPDAWRVAPEWEPQPPPPRRFQAHGLAVNWDRRGFVSALHPLRPHEDARLNLPRRLQRIIPLRRGQNAVWLRGFCAYLRYRLRQAQVDPKHLRLAGQIAIAEGQLTVRIALADLPLALRLAGLDRDPGWLPAEGRAVRFEFT